MRDLYREKIWIPKTNISWIHVDICKEVYDMNMYIAYNYVYTLHIYIFIYLFIYYLFIYYCYIFFCKQDEKLACIS